MKNTIQNRDGLPDALAEEKRFFELRSSSKTSTPSDWNNPEKWCYLDEIPEGKYFGFAIGNNSNYVLIDGDHVIDPESGKMVQWVNDVYLRLAKVCTTYTERSQSGTGFHMIADLGEYAENFSPVSNKDTEIIVDMNPEEYSALPKDVRDKTPKIEIFYHQGGRYVFLTGQNKKLHQIAKNEDAAALFSELLKIREEYHEKHGRQPETGEGTEQIRIDEATRERVLEALPYISANDRETWVRVGLALYKCGFSFEIWDEWSQFKDQRTGEACDKYDPKETPYIWKSFKDNKSNWNAGTIITLAKENGYIPKRKSLIPEEFSDVEQAEIFCSEYGDQVRYSKATGFLKYSGTVWEESDLKVQRLAQKLTDRQLDEVREMLWKARATADELAESGNGKASLDEFLDSAGASQEEKRAKFYRKKIVNRRTSQRIAATLNEAAPRLEVRPEQLDRDKFLLNTPGGAVDLRTGEIRPNNPLDYCTKITNIAPGETGSEIFEHFLDQVTCNDEDLKKYLQEIFGEFLIGEVKREEAYLATGSGGNGKSTLFNLFFKILGSYAGMISSDVLITQSKKNKSPELAELRGKRLIIAAELDEGKRLDAGTLKTLSSTDPIRAEKKYREPFDFFPSHSLVLYTNHLPKVGSRDEGTWDRVIVIPFNARFRDTKTEIKDYASVLFKQCGGAALSWAIEGARRYIENGYRIELPECVRKAIDDYKNENDWLSAFIESRCYVNPQCRATASDLYRAYRDYCDKMGEFPRHSSEFKKALEGIGIEHKKTSAGMVFRGVRLKDWEELETEKSQALREA